MLDICKMLREEINNIQRVEVVKRGVKPNLSLKNEIMRKIGSV